MEVIIGGLVMCIKILIALIPVFMILTLWWVWKSLGKFKAAKEEKRAAEKKVEDSLKSKRTIYTQQKEDEFYSPKHVLKVEGMIALHQLDKISDGLERRLKNWWTGRDN